MGAPYRTVFFFNLDFFDIGPPYAVGSAGYLTARDAYSMPGLDRLVADFTFCHDTVPPVSHCFIYKKINQGILTETRCAVKW
jgi:hypothetical protein